MYNHIYREGFIILHSNNDYDLLTTVYSIIEVKGLYQRKELSEKERRIDMIRRETIQLFRITGKDNYYQINIAGRPGIFVKVCLNYTKNGSIEKNRTDVKKIDNNGLAVFRIDRKSASHENILTEVWCSDDADFSGELRRIKSPLLINGT